MTTTALGNLDVWQEILKHFEVSFEVDDPTTVKQKRNAALTVALLSRQLIEPGLNTLWKNMASILPISNVINSWEGGSIQYLLYHKPTSAAFSPAWHLCQPITDQGLRDHIQGYLKRVRTIHVQLEMKEIELWGLVSTLLHSTFILPNIKHLSVQVDTTFMASGNTIGHLLSPSLHSVTLVGSWSIYLRTIQNYVLSHSLPELVELNYRNDPREVPEGLRHFPKLKKLWFSGRTIFGLNSRLVDRLNALVNLEELEISLRPNEQNPNPPTLSPLVLPNLHTLQLTIFYPEMLQSLFLFAHLPSLHTLSVTVLVGASSQVPILSTDIPALQSLRHLSISVTAEPHRNAQVFTNLNEFEDVDQFTTLTGINTLETLNLINVPYRSVEANLRRMIKSWSKLQALSVERSDGGSLMESSVLLHLTHCLELNKITLPLDFTFLTEPLPGNTELSPNRLTELRCNHWKGIPTKGRKKIIVIRNLLRLFPHLRRIFLAQDEEGLTEELQELIVSYRELLSSYRG